MKAPVSRAVFNLFSQGLSFLRRNVVAISGVNERHPIFMLCVGGIVIVLVKAAMTVILNLVDRCYKKEWIAHCKPPFKDSSGVIHYLGRYTHRVAISNNRILNVRNSQVTFKWRDYSDGNKEKVMTLSAMEFIRRVPASCPAKKVYEDPALRIMGNRNKTKKLTVSKRLTNTPIRPKEKLPARQLIQKLIGHDITTFPVCGTLLKHSSLPPPLVS